MQQIRTMCLKLLGSATVKPMTKNKKIIIAMEFIELIAYIVLGLITLPIVLLLNIANSFYNKFKKLINV